MSDFHSVVVNLEALLIYIKMLIPVPDMQWQYWSDKYDK